MLKSTCLYRSVVAALLAGLLSGHASAGSATDASESRPRVGLVLGGGGARGAAHIGVLKELERMRIPVDAIAGTSMGAIVGGLYASGMSTEGLETLVASLDWADAFQDSSERRNRPYRRKQDDAAFPMRFELGYRDGELQIPLGLVQGQKLGLILRRLTLDVSDIRDFDRLPIPYRAVASDIETGEAIVLSRGDLPLAIRASMSAPGLFAPVVVEGRTLVDGGLTDNVPVDVVRQMGVDVVIAVDVEFPLYEPEEMQSALDITAQMLTILIRKETQRQLSELGEDDFLIRPDLGKLGSTSFGDIMQAIEPGSAATRRLESRLRTLSLDEAAYRSHIAGRQAKAQPPESLAFVRVRDDGPLSERVLASQLKVEPGDPVDTDALANDASRLYGLRIYERVDYRLVTDGDDTGIEFETRSKSWGPNYLKFGIRIEDDFQGNTAFNVAGRLTRAGLNALGAEWRTDLQLGTEPFLFSEFYQPLSFDTRFFVAPRVLLERTNFNVFSGTANVARYRVGRAEGGVDLGRQLGFWGEIRAGVFTGTGTAKVKTGDPALPDLDADTGGLFASFNVDTLDNAQIPLAGSRVQIEWRGSRPGLGGDNKFDSLETDMFSVWTAGRHTLNAGITFNTTIDSELQIQNFFPLGGFLNLSGFARGEIAGPHAGVARLVYYRRSGEITRDVWDMPLYLGASLEAGNVWQTRSAIGTDSLLLNGSLFAAIETYFGPFFVAAGFGEGGEIRYYLSLGSTSRLNFR